MQSWDVLEEAGELTRRGQPFALATVVWRQGPSSGQQGSRAIITAGGDLHGWIGGACAEPVVIRSDPGNTDRVRDLAPDVLVLGPGPGHPLDSGHVELVHEFAGQVPILGVCLGHQAIGAAYGATVSPAAHIMHGKTSTLDHDGRGMFREAERDQVVTRYHSLVVEDATLPSQLSR